MRSIGLGLLAALIVAVMTPAVAFAAPPAKGAPAAISAEQKKKGMADAPALAQAAGLTCDVTDARWIGTAPADKKTGSLGSSLYEVACGQGGMGYLLQTNATGAPNVFSCLEANYPNDPTQKAPNPCLLPGNADPKTAIAPMLTQAKVGCAVDKVRGIGQTKTNTLIEVLCTGGRGYIVTASAPLDPSKPATSANCLAYDSAEGNIKCILADSATRLKMVDAIAQQANNGCAVKDRRFVGLFTDGTEGYEVACNDGKGYIYKVNTQGQIASTLDCAKVPGGTCTLTDTRAALAEQAGLYSKLAANAGSKCQVQRYAVFPMKEQTEIVELVCTDGNGAIGMFPATGKGKVLDCGHALVAGYKCSLGKADYSGLTADLNKFDKKECQVSSVGQPLKAPDGAIRLEVACSDGLPGYMITFTDPQTPKEVVGCTFAGNCVLPTNKKKG
jgi:hypothetical protein